MEICRAEVAGDAIVSIEAIFRDALARPPALRTAFLDARCAGEPELRAAVEALLKMQDASESLLDDRPPDEPAHTVATGNGRPPETATLAHTPGPEVAPGLGTKTADYAPISESGILIAGRYTLQQKIGEGGMGEVWVARQTEPVKRKVALKLIKTGMDSRAVLQRFEQERQALAMMDHPHIAKVLDGGLTPTGQPFFVMELVNGLPLCKFCDELKLTTKERLELFVPICQAVQHAHQKGVIHRDLKPANILVTTLDGKPVPKVIDFGVAKATSGKLTDESMATQFGAILGTLEYMAPEQAAFTGEDIDTRADIYSLGVILYELLTGLRPIDGKRLTSAAFTELIRIIREEEPSKPSTRLSTDVSLPALAALRQTEPRKLMTMLRGELDWVVMKCLEKRRERRYETANGLARDIERYLADEVVEARPPSAGYRLAKYVRRHKGQVIAASLILLAVLGGLGAVVAVQARSNRALAEKNAELAKAQAKMQARFELAQKAIKTFHTGVSKDAILKSEQLRGLRTMLLKEAAGFYTDLEKLLEGQTDIRSRRALAEGYGELAQLTWSIGSRTEALAVYRKQLAIYRELAAASDADVAARKNVVTALTQVGSLLQDTGSLDEALQVFEEARDLGLRLAAESATDAARTALADAHHAVGNMISNQGKKQEALAEYQKAAALYQHCFDANPDDVYHQNRLANVRNTLGAVLVQMGRLEDGLAQNKLACDIRQKQADANPTNLDYQGNLAFFLVNKSEILMMLGHRAEALATIERVRTIDQTRVDANPSVSQFQRNLAVCHIMLGDILAQTGKQAEALEAHEKARSILRKLVDANPAVTEFQYYLIVSQAKIAKLLSAAGKPAEALAESLKAVVIWQKLADANPTQADFQSSLAESQTLVAKLLLAAGRKDEALARNRRAVAIRQKLVEVSPANSAFQNDLAGDQVTTARLLLALGKHTEALGECRKALAIRQKLAEADPADGQSQYNLSCVYAFMNKCDPENPEQGDRALESLRRAIAAGWKDAAELKKNRDLDPLPDREDFKKLLAELERGAEKK